MEIKFLKAGSGDSILIHHKNQNIIVDGGNDSKYLISEVDEIYHKKEVLDLIVITHHDDDHIRGIIVVLKHIKESKYHNKEQFVKRVIFNSPRKILGELSLQKTKELSYKQAYDVEELLIELEISWEMYTEKSDSIKFDEITLKFLAPTQDDLKKYSSQKGVYLTGDFRCDWESPLSILDKYIDDKSIDRSISNRSSIVINLEIDSKKILLTGDITPDRLESALNNLSKGNKPIPFDFIKLPHHGSSKSLTKSVLEKLDCKNFIISTNSKKHFLPNKRALLKIAKYSNRKNEEPIYFHFNYEEAISNLNINSKERKDYNFELIPNNKKYGISI